MNKVLPMIFIFILGFTIRDISNIFITPAKASSWETSTDLTSDVNFRLAVDSIIDDHHFNADNDNFKSAVMSIIQNYRASNDDHRVDLNDSSFVSTIGSMIESCHADLNDDGKIHC